MKKFIRILLSPFLFIFMLVGLVIIPIGPICLLMGLMMSLSNLLSDKPRENEWDMIFIWFVLPYISAKQWIEDGTIPD